MTELIQQIISDGEKTDLYVSELGNLYRQQKDGEMRKLKIGHRRYWEFRTTVNGQYKSMSPHRLVAEYFVPGKSEINNVVHHIDGNPLNNHYKNLQWVSQDYNVKIQDIGFDRNKKQTNLYKNGVLIQKFESQNAAGDFIKELGFSKSSLIRYKKVASYTID